MQSLSKMMWCTACCAVVETVIREEATVLGPAIGAALSLAGARRRSAGEALLAGLVGAGLGFVVEQVLIPKAQALACGNCGCSHLAEHAA